MKYYCILILLAFLTLAYQANEAAAFPWGCSKYSGVCRPVCLAAELPFGPFGCSKGFVCCVAHVI
uniref:Beta-defensin n=1 Tax=Plecoglossus altivelis TaxID=61084 RepID=A0A2S1NBT7_PLEAT|nr:beta-defensin [Plecoglossus altivelis]AWG96839.1 beta-defensin [Plecoglossus altivelis]